MVENEIWEADVRWKSCSMELACLHAGRFCEHPLSVFEAVLKFSRRLVPDCAAFHFLPEHPVIALKAGRRYRLRLVFPSASEDEVTAVQDAVRQWLNDTRNHFAVSFGRITCEDAASALAALPDGCEDELCLDIISPLPIAAASAGKASVPDGSALIALFLKRVEKLFGPMPQEHRNTLLEAGGRIRAIPYSWEYKEYRHASKSAGGTQFLNGFQGRLLLQGDMRPLLPLIAIGAGIGLRSGFGLGAVRVLPADLLRQEWTSPRALRSSLEFLNSHGYGLSPACADEVKSLVRSGGTLSTEGLLLAQEAFLRLLHSVLKRAFPLTASAEQPFVLSWERLKRGSQNSEAGIDALFSVLSQADRELMPLIRKVWTQDGVPQMLDLRTRARAGMAVEKAAELGLEACLCAEGIALADAGQQDAMLDLLARTGIILIPEEEQNELGADEEERLIPWKRSLHILHPHAAIGLDDEAVTARYDGEMLQRTPLGQVSSLILHGAGSVSTPLIRHCMDRGIPIVLCGASGRITGSMMPQSPSWRKRGRDHAIHWERFGEAGRFALAKELIAAKIGNYLCKPPRIMEGKREFKAAGKNALKRVYASASPAELRGVEGSFAKLCFRAHNDCLVKPEFRSGFRESRSRRDLWNTALDTASSLTFNRIAMELMAEGLDPYLGFFHCQNLRYMTLAADIQELFRGDVERWLIRVINENILREEHFMQEGGQFQLTKEGRVHFLVEWEKGMQTKYAWQEDSPANSLSRQLRSLRLWMCYGQPLQLYRGTGWQELLQFAFLPS